MVKIIINTTGVHNKNLEILFQYDFIKRIMHIKNVKDNGRIVKEANFQS